MKKNIIGGAVILLVVAIVLGSGYMFCKNKENDDEGNDKSEEVAGVKVGDLINFQLYKSYEFDTSAFCERFNVVKGTPFTYFDQVYNLDGLKRFGDFSKIYSTLPNFDDVNPDDYRDKLLVVSIGRRVVEMEIIKEAVPKIKSAEAAITFAEEYQDSMMFVYIMDKIHLWMGWGSEFYIMNGTEKVFVGCDALNLK